MTELRGNQHSAEYLEFFLQDNSSKGDRIMRTREITRHRPRKGEGEPFLSTKVKKETITPQQYTSYF